MRLKYGKQDAANNKYRYITNLLRNNPDTYEKADIKKCEECNGTGLDYEEGADLICWSGDYCEKCNGIGFFHKEYIDDAHYFCPSCEGKGCKHCEFGITDWIRYLRICKEKD